MAINYYWTINPLECYPSSSQGSDYVFTAHWQFHGYEEVSGSTYSNTVIGTEAIPMNTGSFIPFEQLTLPVVQGWVEEAMGPEKVEAMKLSVAQNIQNQITPPTVTLQSPWLTTGSI